MNKDLISQDILIKFFFQGSGNGTNTFGENVGEKIGSRRVIIWASVIMMIQGVFGKLGAIFILVPDPVVGGMFLIMFGMITAFGFENLSSTIYILHSRTFNHFFITQNICSSVCRLEVFEESLHHWRFAFLPAT